jgi:hypothetical protein
MPHPTPDPRKSNVSGLPRPRAPVHLGKPAELDQPCLVGMKAERKAGQTLPEIVKELLRVAPMLETDDRIVRIAHDDHIAGGVSFPPLPDPEIVDVVQVDVCQQRRHHRPLRRPLLRPDQAHRADRAAAGTRS